MELVSVSQGRQGDPLQHEATPYLADPYPLGCASRRRVSGTLRQKR